MHRVRQLQQEKTTKENTASVRFPNVKAKIQSTTRPPRLFANDAVALARASLQQENPLSVDQGLKRIAWNVTLFPTTVQTPPDNLETIVRLEAIPQNISTCERSNVSETASLSHSFSSLQCAGAKSDTKLMSLELDQDDASHYKAR